MKRPGSRAAARDAIRQRFAPAAIEPPELRDDQAVNSDGIHRRQRRRKDVLYLSSLPLRMNVVQVHLSVNDLHIADVSAR